MTDTPTPDPRIVWAVQKHQDNHAAEGKTERWHCGGSDCGEEIALEYARLTKEATR